MKNLLVFLLSICLISDNLTLVKAEDQGSLQEKERLQKYKNHQHRK